MGNIWKTICFVSSRKNIILWINWWWETIHLPSFWKFWCQANQINCTNVFNYRSGSFGFDFGQTNPGTLATIDDEQKHHVWKFFAPWIIVQPDEPPIAAAIWTIRWKTKGCFFSTLWTQRRINSKDVNNWCSCQIPLLDTGYSCQSNFSIQCWISSCPLINDFNHCKQSNPKPNARRSNQTTFRSNKK